ncbi:MAG: hypothetical protein L0H96_16345 [Humibacillus sp.]|nr:hypothetical protein [Humibacillus sp.]MDN5778468.1 hypothetical protein [Humibacillus sp.]
MTQEAARTLGSLRGLRVVGEVLEAGLAFNGGRWVQLADHTGEITILVPGERLRRAKLTLEVGNVLAVSLQATPRTQACSWYWTVSWVSRTDVNGPMTRQLTRAMDQLVAEGVIDASRRACSEIAQPPSDATFPQLNRVLVLTSSATGAGCVDLRVGLSKTLRAKVEERYVSKPGTSMAQGCIAALSEMTADEADLIVVARGGGSREDLRQFDSPDLVRAIRACPIPVATAVGHATDISWADRAAFAVFRTPSSAAQYLNGTEWRLKRARARERELVRTPRVAGPDREAARTVEALTTKLALVNDHARRLQGELHLAQQARDHVWAAVDTHLVAAAVARMRRRSAVLSGLALAWCAAAVISTLTGLTPPATEWLVAQSIVGAAAAVVALYFTRGPRRAQRSATSRDIRRQAVSGSEWIERMSTADTPRDLRALFSRRPRGEGDTGSHRMDSREQ